MLFARYKLNKIRISSINIINPAFFSVNGCSIDVKNCSRTFSSTVNLSASVPVEHSVKTYINADLDKLQILEENKDKSGVYF